MMGFLSLIQDVRLLRVHVCNYTALFGNTDLYLLWFLLNSIMIQCRPHRHYGVLWAALFGGYNRAGLRNELNPFLSSFLTHVFVHSTTFESSLKVLLPPLLLVLLLLFFFFGIYSTMARSGGTNWTHWVLKKINRTQSWMSRGMSMSGRRQERAFKIQCKQFSKNQKTII